MMSCLVQSPSYIIVFANMWVWIHLYGNSLHLTFMFRNLIRFFIIDYVSLVKDTRGDLLEYLIRHFLKADLKRPELFQRY